MALLLSAILVLGHVPVGRMPTLSFASAEERPPVLETEAEPVLEPAPEPVQPEPVQPEPAPEPVAPVQPEPEEEAPPVLASTPEPVVEQTPAPSAEPLFALGYAWIDAEVTAYATDEMTMIGQSAFSGCCGFTGSLTIGSSVTTIGNHAFSDCIGFRGLSLPAGIKYIGSAFYSCEFSSCYAPKDSYAANWLRNHGFAAQYTSIPLTGDFTYTAQNGELTITGYEGEMGYGLNIPDRIDGMPVVAIAPHAFEGRLDLKGGLSVNFNVRTIREDAFKGCSNLTSMLWFWNGMVTFEGNPFAGCNFTSFRAPDGSKALQWLVEHGHGLSGDQKDFSYTINNAEATITGYVGETLCDGLTIPASVGGLTVVAVRDGAFKGRSDITGSLNLPNLSTIGAETYSGCSGLTGELRIPSNVKAIGDNAFYGCSGFTGDLTLQQGVTSIGYGAFLDCGGLASITVPSTVNQIGDFAFPSQATIYVEQDSYAQQFYDSQRKMLVFPATGTGRAAAVDQFGDWFEKSGLKIDLLSGAKTGRELMQLLFDVFSKYAIFSDVDENELQAAISSLYMTRDPFLCGVADSLTIMQEEEGLIAYLGGTYGFKTCAEELLDELKKTVLWKGLEMIPVVGPLIRGAEIGTKIGVSVNNVLFNLDAFQGAAFNVQYAVDATKSFLPVFKQAYAVYMDDPLNEAKYREFYPIAKTYWELVATEYTAFADFVEKGEQAYWSQIVNFFTGTSKKGLVDSCNKLAKMLRDAMMYDLYNLRTEHFRYSVFDSSFVVPDYAKASDLASRDPMDILLGR